MHGEQTAPASPSVALRKHASNTRFASRRIGHSRGTGQVLVSNVVMELCEGKTFEFSSLGAVSLKGFADAVMLFELTNRIEAADVV